MRNNAVKYFHTAAVAATRPGGRRRRRKETSVFLFVCLAVALGTAQAQLKVDFSPTVAPVEAGYQGYFADHEQAATFTSQSFTAFGTVIAIAPTWAADATRQAMQMIDRGAAGRTGYTGEHADLLNDWIGTDARQAGDPMTLTVSGLPAGDYLWTSYHHDTQDQTGLFDVTVTDADGSVTIRGIDISDGLPAFEDVTKFETLIRSDGVHAVTLSFENQGYTSVSEAFFVMNGFVLESPNPCYNAPPVVAGPEVLSVFAGEPVVIDVTVADDGRPWVEGCNAGQPQTGTPYGLQYEWSQQSGPASVEMDAPGAEDLRVVFLQAGTYEMRLQVADGPLGSGLEDGKTAEFLVTVEVREPLAGDADRNGIVDYLDLRILADQWLHEPACPESSRCADFDHSGRVTARDFAFLAANWRIETANVVINEFVASNRQSLRDGDGNTPDWIELYNGGTEAVFLDGWYLTDDRDNLRKWAFPSHTVLPAGGYLVVFASGQVADDTVDKDGCLHTNFALDKNGEYLALAHPGGRVVHEFAPAFPPQEPDVSYGMWHTQPRYFAVPTPGQPNEEAFPGFTAQTSHSHTRGFYDEPFDLRIFCTTPDVLIRYTLDGSEPTEQNGLLYDPQTPIPITTTKHVRSVAFKPGWRTARVTTHTYIFVDDVARQPARPPGWPTNWGYSSDAGSIVPADYEMDPRVVNSTLPGYSVRDALLDIPTVSISMRPSDFIGDDAGIYANPQSRWERKCAVEYILPDGAEGFQHDCKIEVHGNASRRPYRMQKHSLRLTFTSLYGPPKLEYPLFPESDVEEFNQLVLRASFTDSWALVSWSSSSRYRPNDSQYIRDVWMKESLRDMGQPSSYGHFVHLYVNGLYFGIHNLTERVADDFFASHLGGEPEDWEINEDFSSPGPRWREMLSINPAAPAGYAQMQEYLDVENFADYMLLHFYADSEDWPHHNGYAAVNAVSGDGKFRFFVWDQEIVLDYHGRAASRINSSGGAGDVFQKLRASAEFRLLFADRVYKHMFHDGALSVTASQQRYAELADSIDKAIVAESARWGDTQMSTPYGNTIEQPNPPDDINHNLYPPAPHGPDYYFTREDSWVVERDNVIDNYIPAIHDTANSYALINVLRARNLYPDIDPPEFRVNGADQHGGYVRAGDTLTMVNPNAGGAIYYTLDGTDPRQPDTGGTGTAQTLVAEDAAKAVWVPTANIGLSWTGGAEPFDDSTWTDGMPRSRETLGGVGYERSSGYEPYISYDVESQMYNAVEACYIRIPFAVEPQDRAGSNYMTLRIRYDDGFVAYLNGTRIASANASASPAWNEGAAASHGDGSAVLFEEFDCSAFLSSLHAGGNVLAIHGMNYRQTSSDFLISVELVAGEDANAEGISPSADVYSQPLLLTESAQVKARIWASGQWSALHETLYTIGSVAESLRITELMYHPAVSQTEFIELANVGTEPIDLNGTRFTGGVEFTFPRLLLGPQEYVLVVQDASEFASLYDTSNLIIAGQYAGRLDNAGETIELQDAAGAIIHRFAYHDEWYPGTDGQGYSLSIEAPTNPDAALWGRKNGWRPSTAPGGSPGYAD